MATVEDVRDIAMRLPGTVELVDRFGFGVESRGKERAFIYAWNERVHPKKARVPNLGVLVVWVRNLSEKEILVGSDPEKYFTEPHYNGYSAVLVRLENVSVEELEDLIIEAWRLTAPADVVQAFDAGRV